MRSRTNGGGAAGVQPETATATRLLTPPHGSPNNLVVAWSIVQLFLPMQSCWTMAVVVLRVEQTWPLASCETGVKGKAGPGQQPPFVLGIRKRDSAGVLK